MAEGWARHLGSDVLEVYSAGTHPTDKVNEHAVEVMKEAGVDLTSHYPKTLEDIPFEMDILIKMGCGVVCPFVPNKYEEDWGLEDPVGKPIEEFRKTRDIIKSKTIELIENVRNGNYV